MFIFELLQASAPESIESCVSRNRVGALALDAEEGGDGGQTKSRPKTVMKKYYPNGSPPLFYLECLSVGDSLICSHD